VLLEGSEPVVNKRGQDGFLSGVRRIGGSLLLVIQSGHTVGTGCVLVDSFS